MYLIAGLGNPGKEYEGTRHNAGFHVIDLLADELGIRVKEKQGKALVGKGMAKGEKVLLVKPQTYMNLSGESIRALVDYYKIDETTELIVVSDDIELDVGRLRIRKKGSAGGHNGLKNIIQHLGHMEFIRLKVGVGGKKEGQDLVNHVLGSVAKADRETMEEASERAVKAILTILSDGVDQAMNEFNR